MWGTFVAAVGRPVPVGIVIYPTTAADSQGIFIRIAGASVDNMCEFSIYNVVTYVVLWLGFAML
jgi:hypothetical protein